MGLLVLSAYILGIAALWAFDVRTPFGDPPPDPALSRGITVLSGITLLASLAVGIRCLGARRAASLIVVEVWPGLLAGWALSLLTGLPLRAATPAETFWPVLAVVYGVGMIVIVWFAIGPPWSRRSSS